MDPRSAPEQFARALDVLIERVKGDRAIIAALICGSLAHDTVWARSDIDLVLITIDDKLVEQSGCSLDAGGRVVATGAPEDIARCKASFTGQFLRKKLT